MKALSLSDRMPRAVQNGHAHPDVSAPFRAFHHEMDLLLDDAFAGFGFTRHASNLPAVEVQEAQTEYRVSIDLPGVAIDDIDLRFKEGALRVKAERKSPDGATLYNDRWSGGFERVIGIDAGIDESQIRATLSNGVLTVSLPKRADRLPRRIEIQ
jgi:HSP20 family protein